VKVKVATAPVEFVNVKPVFALFILKPVVGPFVLKVIVVAEALAAMIAIAAPVVSPPWISRLNVIPYFSF
jgi:hypothetical protein